MSAFYAFAGGAPDGDGEYLTTLPSDDEEPDKCVEYLTVTQGL